MELNKIIRKTGIPHSAVYTKFVADLTEATKDINGMTKEEVKETKDTDGTVRGKAHTRFYHDATKTKYNKVVTDASCGMRVQFTCSSNTIDIDGGSNSQAYAAYNIAKTAYGFMFTTIARVNNATTAQSDGTFQNFITIFKDKTGKTLLGFIHVVQPNNETSTVDYRDWIYIATGSHDVFEMQRALFQMIGSDANQTVMYNASSYAKQLTSEHLFKKIQSESGRFGKIKLDNRTFISGSHFCLECKT